MKKIIVDTTVTKKATVTLLDGNQTIDTVTGLSPLPLIQQLLSKHHLKIAGVEFELVNEKGSYTGLKIGASIINALNFTKGIKKLVFPKY